MKNKLMICRLLSFVTLYSFGQEFSKKLNFILIIDDEIPVTNISKGCFLIKDNLEHAIDTIPFKYNVGSLEVSQIDYDKLFYEIGKSSVVIRFYYLSSITSFNPYLYEVNIGLSKDYVIMRVFNKKKSENTDKYEFANKQYLVQTQTSMYTTLLHYRRDWIRKYRSNLNQ